MKYLSEYKHYFENKEDLDPFGEEEWDEEEPDGTFLYWLKQNYPDEMWDEITEVACDNNQLTSLEGIENLKNLEWLDCSNDQLTDLKEIENLENLEELWCSNNQLTDEYINYLREYCKENNIKLTI